MRRWWKSFVPTWFKASAEEVLRFDAPSSAHLETVRTLLASLKPVRSVREEPGKRYVRGDADEIVKCLRTVLDADYRENMEEAGTVAWLFGYVVYRGTDLKQLNVLTRLYHEGQSGNILYGRFIIRLDATNYLMRIDD